MKPVVHYKDCGIGIHVGMCAIVFPLNHMPELVSNTSPVRTSNVLSYDKETGNFETENSLYVLMNYGDNYE